MHKITLQCGVCSETFSSQKSFDVHVKTHKNVNEVLKIENTDSGRVIEKLKLNWTLKKYFDCLTSIRSAVSVGRLPIVEENKILDCYIFKLRILICKQNNIRILWPVY